MNDKVFRKLQRQFFYVPLIIGWALVIIACALVSLVSRVETMNNVENNLLRASTGPYFQSDNFVYVVVVDNYEPTTYYTSDYFSRNEIQAVVENVTQNNNENGSFSTSSGRRYKYISTRVKESGKNAIKYTVIDYTKSYKYLQTMNIMLTCICVGGMVAIFLFFYFFAGRAIKPVKQSFLRQQELIANASHELKTPLTVVKTNLELIQSDKNSTVADNAKWLDSAGYQLDRMQSLILDMLELTKYESKNTYPDREEIQINDIVEGMTLSFEAVCYEKSITLDYSAEEDIHVAASKTEIEKIVGVLLDNALKYTPPKGKMTLTLQKTRRHAVISLTNTGEGIEQEKLDHIFDRFYKVDPSHKDTGNSFGLGLSIAKSIVDSLKGKISCESQAGEYTRFVVELPLCASSSPSKEI